MSAPRWYRIKDGWRLRAANFVAEVVKERDHDGSKTFAWTAGYWSGDGEELGHGHHDLAAMAQSEALRALSREIMAAAEGIGVDLQGLHKTIAALPDIAKQLGLKPKRKRAR